MRLYPASPTGLSRTFAGDVAVVLALVLFAWMGFKVHDGIAELGVVGRGIQDSGRAIASTGAQTTRAVDGAFANVAGRVNGVQWNRGCPRSREVPHMARKRLEKPVHGLADAGRGV